MRSCKIFFIVFILFSNSFAGENKSDKMKSTIRESAVFTDSNISAPAILSGSCNVPDKMKNINRYLEGGTTIGESAPGNRRWNITKIFRDVHKEGTELASPLPESCLFDLLKLSIKETGQNAYLANEKNQCFKDLESLKGAERDNAPPSCPKDAWKEAVKLSQFIEALTISIEKQEAEVANAVSAAAELRKQTEGRAGCLDCLNVALGKVQQNGSTAEEAKNKRSRLL